MLVLCFAIVIFLGSNMAFKLEPSSCSSFHYEEQTLEKMIRLQISVEKMKEEMDATQLKVRDGLNTFSTDRANFQTEIQELKAGLATTKADLEDDLTITKMQDSIKQLTDDVLKIKESPEVPPVAFHSHKVEDGSMADNKVIKFTTIMINYKDAYNKQTGTFTVPVSGVYIFSAQLYVASKGQSYYGIFVNDTYVQRGLLGDADWNNVYTLVAVADVTKGDLVTVRCLRSCTGDRLNENSYSTSSFSGVLIHRK